MKTIKCPSGHGEMRQKKIHKTVTFRGMEVPLVTKAYVCTECGLEAGTVASAGVVQRTIANAYRKKAGLLTGTEIRDLRKERGLTQKQLADLLKVGVASIKRWETGLIQSKAMDHVLSVHLKGQNPINKYSGDREFSIERIKLVAKAMENALGKKLLKKTDKMLFTAKYLWYADMAAYRCLGKSMTGSTYAALKYGPQLNNYRDLVDNIKKADETNTQPLTADEMNIIDKISKEFPNERMVYDAAHREKVFKETPIGALIPYSRAFDLTEIKL